MAQSLLSLDPRFKHCKDDEAKKKEIEEAVKIEMLKASDCDVTNNEACIQEVQEQIFQHLRKRSKLGKFLGKRYGLGNFQSDGGADDTSGSGMSPLEKAKNEMTVYLQYPQLDIADCPLDWWKKEAVVLRLTCGYVLVVSLPSPTHILDYFFIFSPHHQLFYLTTIPYCT